MSPRGDDDLPVAYLYPTPPPWRWKRIHTALVIAFFLNCGFLVVLGWYAGAFAEETIYEVNLVNVMRNDAEMKPEHVAKRLTLDPARTVGRPAGAPGAAPAPGHKPENVHAKAPPKLRIDAPKVTPDNQPAEPDPSMVNNAPPPPDASLNGNPEGVAGGTGNEEGPGGNGPGGTGTGREGNGNGGGGGLAQLVNRVTCLGCHQGNGPNGGAPNRVEPDQIERLFTSIRWKPGGTPHPLTLGVTLNDQGYVKDAVVVVSSGRPDVDESAIQLIKMSKWRYADTASGDTYVEMPMEVYF